MLFRSSWPESYYVTYIPGFDRHVVTASRDGDDAWSCVDHAIGFADGALSPEEAAHQVLTSFWRQQYEAWDQSRWAYLFAQGLIDTELASSWADEVWGTEEPEYEDKGELEDEYEKDLDEYDPA